MSATPCELLIVARVVFGWWDVVFAAVTGAGIPERVAMQPRWTAENRQFVDRAKPAISGAAETSEFYFVLSSVRKSVCTFVRQLRGPHFSTCA